MFKWTDEQTKGQTDAWTNVLKDKENSLTEHLRKIYSQTEKAFWCQIKRRLGNILSYRLQLVTLKQNEKHTQGKC